jgi:hypothetical protein
VGGVYVSGEPIFSISTEHADAATLSIQSLCFVFTSVNISIPLVNILEYDVIRLHLLTSHSSFKYKVHVHSLNN